MEPHMEQANKHLSNFSQFAGQFAKVLIPIVDTAIKMSAEEPVSAYGAYKAANDFANGSKNYKKNKNVSAKSSSNKKDKVKKVACAPASRKAAGKKKHLPTKNKKENNVYGKQIFHTEIAKPTSKTDKKNLDKYLAKQLKIDDGSNLERSDESLDSAASEDECTVSDLCSGEYTLNEGDTFLGDEESDYGDEFSSTKNDVNQAAEVLVQAIISKANKKRKNSELDENKSNSDLKLSNIETKKLKKDGYSNGSLRKSLPAAIHHEAKVEDSNNLCASFGSLEDLKKNTKKKKDVTKSIVTTTSNVKLSPLSPPESVVKLNSIEEGKRVFKWLLNPVTVEDFFAKYWEQKACLIKRQQGSYFSHLISFESIDQMLLQNHVEFTKNIDVTTYKNGVRETLNPEGRALPPVVWDHYAQGCSIRLLNPQTFLPAVYKLCATMQEFFHCLVGANAYLTPPNSQGFAPHYDDIEAFVLQIEGRKRWKLYKPLRSGDILPRYSSHNFNQEDIGKPVLEEVLESGDVLYFPRGTIHQACTEPGYHSLHITLSAYQKQSFADLFEKMLPLMLQRAIDKNLELRRGLPLNVFQHAGIVYSGQATEERTALKNKVNSLMRKCIREMPLEDLMDNAVDQLAKRFQHEALPPEILPAEKLRTVFGSKSRTNACGECVYDYDIDERTNVRLLRANILRLVYEEKTIRIYYYLDNSKQYCEYEPNFIEIDSNEAASVEVLIKFYPQYLGVAQLPMPTDEQKINLVTALWERGLLMMEKPFR